MLSISSAILFPYFGGNSAEFPANYLAGGAPAHRDPPTEFTLGGLPPPPDPPGTLGAPPPDPRRENFGGMGGWLGGKNGIPLLQAPLIKI